MDGDDFFKLGDKADDEGDYETALKWYRESLSNTPKDPKLLARIGRCYKLMGNNIEAIEYFTMALNIKPMAPTTLFMRAQCYELMGNLDSALNDYSSSAVIKPRSDVYTKLGILNFHSGREADAKASFQRAIDLNDDDDCVRIAKKYLA